MRLCQLQRDKRKQASFFVVFYFLFTFSSLSLGSQSEEVQSYLHTRLIFAASVLETPLHVFLFRHLTHALRKTFPSPHLNGEVPSPHLLLLLLSLFPSSFERSSAPPLLSEPCSPHQSSEISFFRPGCLNCYERGAEGAQQQ